MMLGHSNRTTSATLDVRPDSVARPSVFVVRLWLSLLWRSSIGTCCEHESRGQNASPRYRELLEALGTHHYRYCASPPTSEPCH